MIHVKKTIIFVSLVLCFSISFNMSVLAQFSGGSGTETAPFLLKTAEDLNNVRNYPDKYFRVVNDIDLTDFLTDYYSAEGWLPIGDDTNRFKGVIYGGGFEIRGLWIRQSALQFVGFVGVNAGVIDSLGISLAEYGVEGSTYAGGLAGCSYGKITNSYVTGQVGAQIISQHCSGGLVGQNSGEIAYSEVLSVNIFSAYAAGSLVGFMDTGEVSYCGARSAANSSNTAGGLIGYLKQGTVSKSFALGNAAGSTHSGGLIGFVYNGTISDCYALGTSSGSRSGGLIGSVIEGAIANCYAAGAVMGTTAGGFFGGNRSGRITNSYFNLEKSGVSVGVGTGNGNDKVVGLHDDDMKLSKTFSTWNFHTVWNISEGVTFPYLVNASPKLLQEIL